MARKKEFKLEIENPLTREKMAHIASQYQGKSQQELLDMAVDCLFRQEGAKIKQSIERLLGIASIEENVDKVD